MLVYLSIGVWSRRKALEVWHKEPGTESFRLRQLGKSNLLLATQTSAAQYGLGIEFARVIETFLVKTTF
jgi:hypothetical protein